MAMVKYFMKDFNQLMLETNQELAVFTNRVLQTC